MRDPRVSELRRLMVLKDFVQIDQDWSETSLAALSTPILFDYYL